MASSTQTEPTKSATSVKETLESIPEPFSNLLAHYSGVPKEKQIDHLVKLRDEAYALVPYPCIGIFRFIESDLAAHPAYEEHVLSPLKQLYPPGAPEPLFLDLGTCFGQDVRKLVHDGAVANRLWASDIESVLIQLGFKLFNDAGKLPEDHFLCPGDLLSNTAEDKLGLLDNKVTILHIMSVFHLFSLEDQRRAAERCLRLLRKDTGAPVLLLGTQVGNVMAGPHPSQVKSQEYNLGYLHNDQSWAEMWQEVCGQEEWKHKVKHVEVKSTLKPLPPQLYTNSNIAWQQFQVWVTFS